MKKLWLSVFLCNRFFGFGGLVAFVFALSFFIPFLGNIGYLLLIILVTLTLTDIILLSSKSKGLLGERNTAIKLSHADCNPVTLTVINNYSFTINCKIQEELPKKLSLDSIEKSFRLPKRKQRTLQYTFKPMVRGQHHFEPAVAYAKTRLGIIERKFEIGEQNEINVYPSFLKLRTNKLEFLKQKKALLGNNLQGRIGHSQDFEQIRNYTQGDEIRAINWKATARAGKFMVNQYQDEKSQAVYCVIDKGRNMQQSFKQNTLLDRAINSILTLSSTVLENHDKVGIFSFSDRIENYLNADNKTQQLQLIQEYLFNLKTSFKESDFGRLYSQMKLKITQRSLVFLFTQFDNLENMQRQLPYLRAINKSHVLVVIFFKDQELYNYVHKNESSKNPYEKAIAEQFLYEQERIVLELSKYGINCLLSELDNISIDVLNKYVSLKRKALL